MHTRTHVCALVCLFVCVRACSACVCGCTRQSTAITLNPSNPDWSVPFFMSGLQWRSIDAGAKVFLGFHATTSSLCTSGDGCDSYRFALVADEDGSFGGTPRSSVLSATNPALALGSPGCVAINGWGAYYCPGFHLVPSVLLDRMRTVCMRRPALVLVLQLALGRSHSCPRQRAGAQKCAPTRCHASVRAAPRAA
jgi:hypothetical protein